MQRLRRTSLGSFPAQMLLSLLVWAVVNLSSKEHWCLAWPTQDDYFNNLASTDMLGAPLITPTSPDITLEVNSNYTLRCEAKMPIKWEIPELHDMALTFVVENYPTHDPARPYGSQLTLINVTEEYVRYYYCVDESINIDMVDDLENLIMQYNASKIYVFVNDLENLLVPHFNPVVTVFQFSDAVIPCKPTSREVDVNLYTPDGQLHSSDMTGKYDPKLGFIIKILHIKHGGFYTCRPKYPTINNENEEVHFLIHIIPGSECKNESCTDDLLMVVVNNNETEIYESTTSNYEIVATTDTTINTDTTPNDFTTNNINTNSFKLRRSQEVSNGKRKRVSVQTIDEYINSLASTALFPSRATQSINKPTILSASHGHALVGDSFNLTCTVEVGTSVNFNITWRTPHNDTAIKEGRTDISGLSKEPSTVDAGLEIGKRSITIHNAQKEKDAGEYSCDVVDHSDNRNKNKFSMIILDENESYINLSEPSKHYLVKTKAGTPINLLVYYRGYPHPTLTWYSNTNVSLHGTTAADKYIISQDSAQAKLTITKTNIKDSGVYTLRAFNGIVNEQVQFTVFVKDKPSVQMDDVYVQVGEEARIQYRSEAYPKPKVACKFVPCKIKPKWPSCEFETTVLTPEQYPIEEDAIYQVYELKFVPPEPGKVTCTATNEIGTGEKEAEILIGDLTQPVTVSGIDDNRKIAVGDEVILTCAALAYNYSADLYWYRENIPVENDSDVEITTTESDYSYKKYLKFKNIQHYHSGLYECRARPITDHTKSESKILDVFVYDPSRPVLEYTNPDSDMLERDIGDSLRLECKPSGIPIPSVFWHKDNVLIHMNETDNRVILEEGGTVLEIPFIKPEDEGSYKCVVSNRLGSTEKHTQVKITNMPGLKLGWILVISGAFLVLVIFIIYLCIRICRERELRRQLKAAGLANFEEGAIEHINPALSLDEQADLLPYDRRFEFPKEKLKLGKQLGSGAFGVVLKAVAEGIIPEERETIVAVKMVKKTADNEVMKALVSELKIMVHLGQHLNVVNLLGAVTKNIAKREVMVIVEYCRYGNVQHFLLKNRKRFIDQINRETDQIDSTITSREHRWSSDYEYNSKPEPGSRPNTQGYLRQSDLEYIGSNVDSCNTEQTLISTFPEGDSVILSNNSVQPAWRSNYKPDCTTSMDITTTDLVKWAFQVARGMDYLASRKVLHGDLAARNILLCDGNIVKICDFGLARSMYRNDNYKKQGEAPLPIKWLALESLGDQIFSTYSDVWSFGIVLWELFSLAKVPYPGMEADQTLYLKLKDGYRMEKPEFANQELYEIMLACWRANPESRPLFNVLETKLSKLLEDEASNHYIDLNEPYLRVNSLYYKTNQTDYLALMGCPDELAPGLPPDQPRYVNGHILPEIKIGESTPDYLHMSPKSGSAIFSPRPQDDYVKADHFDFPQPVSPTISNNLDSPQSKCRKKSGIPEEIPMLKRTHSDSESELSPDLRSADKKFSKLQGSTEDMENRLTKSDNYVNVHPNEGSKSGGAKPAFSNPSYLMLQPIK